MQSIAQRCGIGDYYRNRDLFFDLYGRPFAADAPLLPYTEILVEGIAWHSVIAEETLQGIVSMWQIQIAELVRANPFIVLRANQMVLYSPGAHKTLGGDASLRKLTQLAVKYNPSTTPELFAARNPGLILKRGQRLLIPWRGAKPP